MSSWLEVENGSHIWKVIGGTHFWLPWLWEEVYLNTYLGSVKRTKRTTVTIWHQASCFPRSDDLPTQISVVQHRWCLPMPPKERPCICDPAWCQSQTPGCVFHACWKTLSEQNDVRNAKISTWWTCWMQTRNPVKNKLGYWCGILMDFVHQQ